MDRQNIARRLVKLAQTLVQRSTDQNDMAFVGALFLDLSTGKIGLAKRSKTVSNPGVWHTTGGGIDSGENRLTALSRELEEELSYELWNAAKVSKLCSHVSKHKTYTVYLVSVQKRFDVTLNHENSKFKWFDLSDLPKRIHPKLLPMLQQRKVKRAIMDQLGLGDDMEACRCGAQSGVNIDCSWCGAYQYGEDGF